MKQDKLRLDEFFKTSDLALSATLLYLGFQLDSLDKSDSSKILFLFKLSTPLLQAVEAFWKDDIRISPLRYFQILRTLKGRLYENR